MSLILYGRFGVVVSCELFVSSGIFSVVVSVM